MTLEARINIKTKESDLVLTMDEAKKLKTFLNKLFPDSIVIGDIPSPPYRPNPYEPWAFPHPPLYVSPPDYWTDDSSNPFKTTITTSS